MSYSFGVKGADKLRAIEQVRAELDKIVDSQPVHKHDRHLVQSAVSAFLSPLAQDDTRDVAVAVNGSIYVTDAGVQSVNCNIAVQLVPRE